MKEAENEKYVYLEWSEAIKLDPDIIMARLIVKAIKINCVPFDVSGKGYPNVYLRSSGNNTNPNAPSIAINWSNPEQPTIECRFVMFVKEIQKNNTEA